MLLRMRKQVQMILNYFPKVDLCDLLPVRVPLCPLLALLGNGISSSTKGGFGLSV
jgi:hypothetical protein